MAAMYSRIATTLLVLLLVMLAGAGCGPAAPARSPVSPPAVASGDGVALWQDASIFDAVRRLLAVGRPGARLWVEMYEFGRADLAAALRSASRAGADVRLVVDPTVAQSRAMERTLAAAGVQVREYPVDERRHQIDHVKLVVTDAAALVGGMNWGRTSAANHDYALRLTEPGEITRLGAIFEQDWALAGGTPTAAAALAGPGAAGADGVAQTTPGEEIRRQLVARIAAARRSIDAEVYTLTDGEVVAALSEAHRRGVRVRMIVDPNQSANERAVADLEAAGVPVRRYPIPKGALLHAKAGLFDEGTLMLGSANWTRSGLSVNHEVDATTAAAAVTAAFEARFARDWEVSA
jgi:phosphatidylserine/phosphatidylglycerophosphate/cardiolipin synthase-like enzyme